MTSNWQPGRDECARCGRSKLVVVTRVGPDGFELCASCRAAVTQNAGGLR